jgi:uncharacterized protein (DUF1697 family)
MPVMVGLLRGVNVGGNNLIRMEALRSLCTALGFNDVCTHLQSGNVLFRTSERNTARIGERISSAIEEGHGFRPAVILRTVPELRAVVANNPFADRNDIHPGKFAVTFSTAALDPGVRDKLLQIDTGPEELHLGEREIYIYFPNGMGRSKLPWPLIERTLKAPLTSRNWNTVTRLLEMAEEMEKHK